MKTWTSKHEKIHNIDKVSLWWRSQSIQQLRVGRLSGFRWVGSLDPAARPFCWARWVASYVSAVQPLELIFSIYFSCWKRVYLDYHPYLTRPVGLQLSYWMYTLHAGRASIFSGTPTELTDKGIWVMQTSVCTWTVMSKQQRYSTKNSAITKLLLFKVQNE